MKTLVLYTTRYGASRRIADIIAGALGPDADEIDLRSGDPDLARYDSVILGGPIYCGFLDRRLGSWCKRHTGELLAKPLGLFISCATPAGTQGYIEKFFPEELIKHARAAVMPGGLVRPDGMRFIDRKIIGMVAKNPDGAKGFMDTTIDEAAARRLAELMR